MLTSVREYLQGGGLAILPEMELVLFALGLFLFSGWKDAAGRAWGASLALAGVVFSSYTVWIVHTRLAAISPGWAGACWRIRPSCFSPRCCWRERDWRSCCLLTRASHRRASTPCSCWPRQACC